MLTFSAGVLFFGIETVGLVSVEATSATETELVSFKASATSDTLFNCCRHTSGYFVQRYSCGITFVTFSI